MTLNMNHLAAACQLTGDQLEDAARPVLTRLRRIGEASPGHVDGAGFAIRGGSVFDDELDGRFSAIELAAACRILRALPGIQLRMIDAIESARIRAA